MYGYMSQSIYLLINGERKEKRTTTTKKRAKNM